MRCSICSECVDLRDPSVGLFGLRLFTETSSPLFTGVLTAGEPGIVLSLFLSASELPGPTVLNVGFDRRVEFIGVLFDIGVVLDALVVRAAVGLLALVRLTAGLVAPPLNGEEEVAVGVRRIGVGAVALEVVLRSVAEDTVDIRFGFAAIPPRFDSSSVVFSSVDVTDSRARWAAADDAVVDEVGFRADEANVGLAGGLLRLEVDVLVDDEAVGFDRRSARLVGRVVVVVVDGFAADRLTAPVPTRLVVLVGSSSAAAWLRNDGVSILRFSCAVCPSGTKSLA